MTTNLDSTRATAIITAELQASIDEAAEPQASIER